MSSEVSTVTGEQSVEELRRELAEVREQQAATAEILASISSSVTDANQVFAKIAATAARLCDAFDAAIFQVDGSSLRLVAHHGQIPFPSPIGQHKIPLVRALLNGRAVIERRTNQVVDMQAEAEEYPEGRELAVRLGWRTGLSVPLLRAGEAIGAILLRRREVRPFTRKQIELLKTFADQAVIAIENTRLFKEVQARTKELQESLEYQTAISNVLGVISRTPTQLQLVLRSIAQTAARLCESFDAQVYRLVDGELQMVAQHGSLPRLPARYQLPLTRGSVTGRAILDRQTVHVDDISALLESEFPDAKPSQLVVGHRTTLATPLIREGQPIGAILLRRADVRPFSPKQVSLLQTFADQAVIAIENTRLFNEIVQKSQELEIASQHKSQFVANMSHELRTPLAAMLGYAELLQEGIYGVQPEKSLPILTRIRSNGKHLLGLINTVLDISKIEAGQFKLNIGEYAMGSIVDTVMVATESLAAGKNLAFTAEVAKALPYGLGDEPRLTQVLLNLVGNAIKFTDAGEVRIAAGAANGYLTVSVSDTGPGIPLEECDRIFEKFRQVDSSNTRTKDGTGLGLAIAKDIIEMHGGRIWVESRLGHGSTFRIELPLRAASASGVR